LVLKGRVLTSLLSAAAGVLIFLSMEHWLHLNGFSKYSLLISLAGVAILIWIDKIKTKIITESVLDTSAAVLIFIGLYPYLNTYTEAYWPMYLIVGIVLLNSSNLIES